MAPSTIRPNTTANRLRSDRRPSTKDLLLVVPEAVPDAAHREQVLGLLRVRLDLLPQVTDVDVDGPRIAIRRVAPYAREEHVAREHAARGARERGEDLELHERRGDRVAVAHHRAL